MNSVQSRNAIDTRGNDRDQGAGTPGLEIPQADLHTALKRIALSQAHLSKMIDDKSYDYSHPVDEYAPQGGTAVITNSVVVQPDYDMPELINAITYILPTGTITAQLQLGQRILNLYGPNAPVLNANITVGAKGAVTAAATAQTIAIINTGSLPVAGTYRCYATVYLDGTATAADEDNMNVLIPSTATSIPLIYPAITAPPIPITSGPYYGYVAAGQAIRIDTAGTTPSGTAVYHAAISATLVNEYDGSASSCVVGAPLVNVLPDVGIILNSDDPRILTITGNLSSAPYLGLTGFALTRGQFS